MPQRYLDGDWVRKNIPYWQSWVGDLAGQPAIIGVELGVYEGRSAVWWATNILTGPNSRLIGVDVWWQHDEVYARAQSNCAELPIELRRTSSRRALADLLIDGVQAAFVYVDADHHASNTLSDMCGAWQILRPGGVMICDDYGWSHRTRAIPPAVAIDGWLNCHRDKIQGFEYGDRQIAIWKP